MSSIEQEDIATVKEISGDKVTFELCNNESCASCGLHGMCGGGKVITHTVKTSLALKKGDKVRIKLSTRIKLASSFIVFVVPVILMIVFYAVGKYFFGLNEDLSVLFSLGGLGISVLFIKFVDVKAGEKINFEIIEKAENENLS
ncbi:MAG: hypothetical protein CSB55_05290 [Candidatus Cloacimonadota bacterium]|nr:MAG: hypothetical protein CSB55_05290 [Candidatus Cloacimonadota bacterium]